MLVCSCTDITQYQLYGLYIIFISPNLQMFEWYVMFANWILPVCIMEVLNSKEEKMCERPKHHLSLLLPD